jgi:hypothetical protein
MHLPVQLAALAQTDCPVLSRCGAGRALSVLYGVSAFLGLLLIAVVGIAVYIYKRNKDGRS